MYAMSVRVTALNILHGRLDTPNDQDEFDFGPHGGRGGG